MTLRVKAGVVLTKGDLVAIDENCELVNATATQKKPIGILMERSGQSVIRTYQNGYVGDVVEVDVDWSSNAKPNSHIDNLMEALRCDHLRTFAQYGVSTSKVFEDHLRLDPHITKVVESRMSKRMLFLGLFLENGQEVQAADYSRVVITVRNGLADPVTFATAASEWGVIDQIGIFNARGDLLGKCKPSSLTPLHVFPGLQLQLRDLKISIPDELMARLPVVSESNEAIDSLSVEGKEKDELKQKMETARHRLKGVFEP